MFVETIHAMEHGPVISWIERFHGTLLVILVVGLYKYLNLIVTRIF